MSMLMLDVLRMFMRVVVMFGCGAPCDHDLDTHAEIFLRHESSMRAYAPKNVLLWGVPAKSPDLNPIEMF